jgi:hypothetical protein
VRALSDIRGLRYPDESLIRHFFRERLHERPGRAVELGCGSGSNLMLYQGFGWRVEGADIDRASLDDARWNLGPDAVLVEADLSKTTPAELAGPYDALLLPSSLYYLGFDSAEKLARDFAPRLSPGCAVYLRVRMTDDYRWGRGEKLSAQTFRLATPETGEAGLINCFYTETQAVELMRRTLDLRDVTTLRVRFDNVQSGVLVPGNSDLVLTGRTPA